MENTAVTVTEAVQTFAEQVTNSINLGEVATILGIAIAVPLSIYLFRWGANLVLSRVRKGMKGRM